MVQFDFEQEIFETNESMLTYGSFKNTATIWGTLRALPFRMTQASKHTKVS